MLKRFLEWFKLKEKMHNSDHVPPWTSEGEIWWVSVGDNVGQEINGKGADFVRPVYIYKKISSSFYSVIPLTSQIKYGPRFLYFIYKNKPTGACLHQVRSIDYKRLRNRMGEVSSRDKFKISQAFELFYKQKPYR